MQGSLFHINLNSSLQNSWMIKIRQKMQDKQKVN